MKKITICIVLILPIFITIFIRFYGDQEINHSWESYVGGLTTLVAAYVAYLIFDGWKEQHNKQVSNTLALKLIESYRIFHLNVIEFQTYVSALQNFLDFHPNFKLDNINDPSGNKIVEQIFNKKEEIEISFRSLASELNLYNVINLKDTSIATTYEEDFFNFQSEYSFIFFSVHEEMHLLNHYSEFYEKLRAVIYGNEIKRIYKDLKV
ncbi:hypothetical protein [Acinetobacter soli]|uniref:hypothetical protein n=1 Tax=Acinetobacter soli TaxID=487316 RepID=UPI00124F8EF7|nr:hypothetical protein [Acinetobacter soli]